MTEAFSSEIWTTVFKNKAVVNIAIPEFEVLWVLFLKNNLRITAQVKIIFLNMKGHAEKVQPVTLGSSSQNQQYFMWL